MARRLIEIKEAIQETSAELEALIEGPLFVTAEELVPSRWTYFRTKYAVPGGAAVTGSRLRVIEGG